MARSLLAFFYSGFFLYKQEMPSTSMAQGTGNASPSPSFPSTNSKLNQKGWPPSK